MILCTKLKKKYIAYFHIIKQKIRVGIKSQHIFNDMGHSVDAS